AGQRRPVGIGLDCQTDPGPGEAGRSRQSLSQGLARWAGGLDALVDCAPFSSKRLSEAAHGQGRYPLPAGQDLSWLVRQVTGQGPGQEIARARSPEPRARQCGLRWNAACDTAPPSGDFLCEVIHMNRSLLLLCVTALALSAGACSHQQSNNPGGTPSSEQSSPNTPPSNEQAPPPANAPSSQPGGAPEQNPPPPPPSTNPNPNAPPPPGNPPPPNNGNPP